jgi:hypothetical protein
MLPLPIRSVHNDDRLHGGRVSQQIGMTCKVEYRRVACKGATRTTNLGSLRLDGVQELQDGPFL